MTVQHTICTRAANTQHENTKMCEWEAYLAEIQKVQQTATIATTDTLGGHHPTQPRKTCEIPFIWAANACRTHQTLHKSVKPFFFRVFRNYSANASPIVVHACTYVYTNIGTCICMHICVCVCVHLGAIVAHTFGDRKWQLRPINNKSSLGIDLWTLGWTSNKWN